MIATEFVKRVFMNKYSKTNVPLSFYNFLFLRYCSELPCSCKLRIGEAVFKSSQILLKKFLVDIGTSRGYKSQSEELQLKESILQELPLSFKLL